MQEKKRRIVILSEGYFGDLEAKTASGLITWRQPSFPLPWGRGQGEGESSRM